MCGPISILVRCAVLDFYYFGVLRLLHVLANFTEVLLIYKARLSLPLLVTA